jgi:DNA-binding CsgD family transcriptional regulator
LLEVSRAAAAAPPRSHAARPFDTLLDGFATLVTEGRPAAAPMLRRAARAFAGDETTVEEGLRWGWLAAAATSVLWDDETKHAIHVRQVQLARDAGALALLSIDLAAQAIGVAWSGDFGWAASLIAEAAAVSEATGTRHVPYANLMLSSLRGREAEAAALIDTTVTDAEATGQGIGVTWARWVAGILYNSLRRYDLALAAAQEATGAELSVSNWVLPELIEAAAHSGQAALAADALGRLTEIARVSDTDWALGIAARSRALVSEGDAAEGLYRHAIERLARTRLRPELARAHPVYGEWLRRERRRVDARDQLRTAHEMFAAIGMEAFEQRAERELLATGEHARKRTVETLDDLTAQELQIAQMARDGLSNPEIGAWLFISPRTVKYHLQKVFTKLDITSRSQLDQALPTSARDGLTA